MAGRRPSSLATVPTSSPTAAAATTSAAMDAALTKAGIGKLRPGAQMFVRLCVSSLTPASAAQLRDHLHSTSMQEAAAQQEAALAFVDKSRDVKSLVAARDELRVASPTRAAKEAPARSVSKSHRVSGSGSGSGSNSSGGAASNATPQPTPRPGLGKRARDWFRMASSSGRQGSQEHLLVTSASLRLRLHTYCIQVHPAMMVPNAKEVAADAARAAAFRHSAKASSSNPGSPRGHDVGAGGGAGGGAGAGVASAPGTYPVPSTIANPHRPRDNLVPCKPNREYKCRLVLRAEGKGQMQVVIRPLLPYPERSAVILSDKLAVVVHPRKAQHVVLTLRLVEPGTCVSCLVACQVVGGVTAFCLVQAQTEAVVFGIPFDDLPQGTAYGVRVPKVLVQMAEYLVANGGLEREGVFRLAPDKSRERQVRAELDHGTFKSCPDDVNLIAHLIKVLLREAPMPVLGRVPVETLFKCTTEEKCVETYQSLKEPEKSVLTFVIRLLAEVSRWSHVNKMTAKNLAIVMGPNLFRPNMQVNPMEALMMSQKAVFFLQLLIERECRLDDMATVRRVSNAVPLTPPPPRQPGDSDSTCAPAAAGAGPGPGPSRRAAPAAARSAGAGGGQAGAASSGTSIGGSVLNDTVAGSVGGAGGAAGAGAGSSGGGSEQVSCKDGSVGEGVGVSARGRAGVRSWRLGADEVSAALASAATAPAAARDNDDADSDCGSGTGNGIAPGKEDTSGADDDGERSVADTTSDPAVDAAVDAAVAAALAGGSASPSVD